MTLRVRHRITFLFFLLVFVILGAICASVYFFSSASRVKAIRTRLTNRGLTTARLLSQSEIFDRQLVERIDSLTTLSLKNKSVQAYNYLNKKIYSYSDLPGDTLYATAEMLDNARVNGLYYFTEGKKEAVAYHYTDHNARIVIICAAEDQDGKENLAQLKNILLLSLIGGIAIALLGGYLFSGRLLAPIRKITREINEISAQDFTRRIETGNTKDEWSNMSDTLNALLNRLQESFELQRRFISNASHELLTPLTAVSSQLEVALLRDRSNQQYEEILGNVLQDVRELSKLTRTLLEFAKAADDKGGINLSPVRVDEILMEMPGILHKLDKRYQVLLNFDQLPENEEELLIFGNEELLSTAIKNIIVNACKYAPDHQAEINLAVRRTHLHIAVTDKGPGIPDSELVKIFQPFYRLDDSRSTEGFGLGLSLAYRIIKLHKGEITVQSEPFKATVFNIRIPAAKQQGF